MFYRVIGYKNDKTWTAASFNTKEEAEEFVNECYDDPLCWENSYEIYESTDKKLNDIDKAIDNTIAYEYYQYETYRGDWGY